MMNDFQCLREKIVSDHKEGLKKRYESIHGERPSDEMIEKMVSESGIVFEEKGELVEENIQQRHEAVKEIQRSLVELHKVFLDMAVMVEVQGEQMNNIEMNVVNGGGYIKDATKELDRANSMKKRRTWACWIGVVVLVFLRINQIKPRRVFFGIKIPNSSPHNKEIVAMEMKRMRLD
ncbi:hypothetical protein DH2020_045325 [Rehmannia glutinosa]|uniref:t-SNARE coiled-coil homology domain-containing protein n=1 Tax=Rehmannia glutinosa TaxID=99300 RepID=A0ABR0UEL3_REHGL